MGGEGGRVGTLWGAASPPGSPETSARPRVRRGQAVGESSLAPHLPQELWPCSRAARLSPRPAGSRERRPCRCHVAAPRRGSPQSWPGPRGKPTCPCPTTCVLPHWRVPGLRAGMAGGRVSAAATVARWPGQPGEGCGEEANEIIAGRGPGRPCPRPGPVIPFLQQQPHI